MVGLDSNPESSESQLAVSGNFLDLTVIRAGPQWYYTASSQWQHLRPHTATRAGPLRTCSANVLAP